MSYFPSIQQSVTPDTANTYSGTIAAGVTWNNSGTGTSTMGVNAIQLVVESTENLTVYVDQGNADNDFQIVDTYEYIASVGNFGITVQAVSAYVRVRAKNNGSSIATVTVDTVLCPIVEALPRSLDSKGNLKVGIKSIEDEYGFEVENTPMGEMRVVQPTRLVGAQFEGNTLDTLFWSSQTANGGTITQGGAQIVLSTAATAQNGSAKLSSYRRARYVSSNSMRFRGVISISAKAANNLRRWGIGYGSSMPATITVTDGAWFQVDGTTFGIAYQKGGGAATVITSFNGVLGSAWVPTDDTSYTYEIYWTNSRVYWVIGGDVLHSISFSTATWANTMNHYIFMESVNSNNIQAAHTLTCRVASISRLGALLTQPTSYYFASGTTAGVNLKLGPGNLHSLIIGNAANNAVITLSDSISASTPEIIKHTAGATYTGIVSVDLKGIPFFTGLRLTVSGANAQLTIIYE